MSYGNEKNEGPSSDSFKHSQPIAINTSPRRSRSVSLSSGSSSSPSEAQTPSPTSFNSNRFVLPPNSNSPILSYFLSQSPTKSPGAANFPFNRKFGPPPVFEEEETEVPVATHARRASTAMANRFSQPSTSTIPEPQLERGSGLLRRLSLSSGAFGRAQSEGNAGGPFLPPPNTAVSPSPTSQSSSREPKHRRSATVNEGVRPHRAPSPMGERILKGHFDGFN